MTAQHQWHVRPDAISVRPNSTPALCDDSLCPKEALLTLSIQGAGPRLLCRQHTKRDIRDAAGQPCRNRELNQLLRQTTKRDAEHRRTRRSVTHLPCPIDRDTSADAPETRVLTMCSKSRRPSKVRPWPHQPTCPLCRAQAQKRFPKQILLA